MSLVCPLTIEVRIFPDKLIPSILLSNASVTTLFCIALVEVELKDESTVGIVGLSIKSL